MDDPTAASLHPRRRVRALTDLADRLDALAEMADLMGDADGAERFRSHASSRRLEAMELLDG